MSTASGGVRCSRRLRHRRDHAPLWQVEARGVEMAGAVDGGGRRRVDARQDTQARQTTASDRHRARVVDLALGPPPGETATGAAGCWRRPRGEPAFGATYPRGPPTSAACIRTFKLSNDPKFAEKLKDVVGLYVDLRPCSRPLGRLEEIPWGVDSDRRRGRVRLLTHQLWRRPCKLSLTDPKR